MSIVDSNVKIVYILFGFMDTSKIYNLLSMSDPVILKFK